MIQNEKDLPRNNFQRKYVPWSGQNIHCWVVFHITGAHENVKLKTILAKQALLKFFCVPKSAKCKDCGMQFEPYKPL